MNFKIFGCILILTIIDHVSGDDIPRGYCCPRGQFILAKTRKCWEPNTNISTPMRISCKQYISPADFSILPDGKLQVRVQELYAPTFDVDVYCLGNISNMKVYKYKYQEVPFICADEEPEELSNEFTTGCCMIISVIFLGITSVIYTALPELRSDLQGKSIISFCVSMTTGLIFLVILKFMAYSDMKLCAVRGFLTYFFIIASFFWANAISIQILATIRQPCVVIDRGWKVFGWYALYSWGSASILTVAVAIVNYHPGNHERPGIGLNTCFFNGIDQKWYYMYSVMSILILMNIIIFVYCVTTICRHSFSSSHIAAVKYKLNMTIRMIVLMGLPWIFEMIGSLFSQHIIWTILDIFNSLQGLLFFLLLVVFRKKVVRAMHKHGWLLCLTGVAEKWLATGQDEENVIEHTEIPINDRS